MSMLSSFVRKNTGIISMVPGGGVVNQLFGGNPATPAATTDTIAGLRAGGIGMTLTRQVPGTSVMNTSSGPMGVQRMRKDSKGRMVPVGWKYNRAGQLVRSCHRMNIGNGRALKRALRRVHGFERIARRVLKVAPRFKKKVPSFGAHRRRHVA